MLEALENFH